MRMRLIACVLTVLTAWGLAADTVMADLPGDRYVDFHIRENPINPASDIEYTVRLELSAVAQDGDSIAWDVLSVTYVEVGTGGAGDRVWTDDVPLPATSNGYWNVTHNDPAEPQNDEFLSPPVLVGTATAADPADADLDYDLSGDECDPQYSQMFGGMVTAIAYSVQFVGDPEPIDTGSDEPVEIDGEDIGTS